MKYWQNFNSVLIIYLLLWGKDSQYIIHCCKDHILWFFCICVCMCVYAYDVIAILYYVLWLTGSRKQPSAAASFTFWRSHCVCESYFTEETMRASCLKAALRWHEMGTQIDCGETDKWKNERKEGKPSGQTEWRWGQAVPVSNWAWMV